MNTLKLIFTPWKSVLFLFCVYFVSFSQISRFFLLAFQFFAPLFEILASWPSVQVSLYWVVIHLKPLIPLHSLLPSSILLNANFSSSLLLSRRVFFCFANRLRKLPKTKEGTFPHFSLQPELLKTQNIIKSPRCS